MEGFLSCFDPGQIESEIPSGLQDPHKSEGQSRSVSTGRIQRDFPEVLPVKERNIRDLCEEKNSSRTIPAWVMSPWWGCYALVFRTVGSVPLWPVLGIWDWTLDASSKSEAKAQFQGAAESSHWQPEGSDGHLDALVFTDEQISDLVMTPWGLFWPSLPVSDSHPLTATPSTSWGHLDMLMTVKVSLGSLYQQ